MNDNDWRLIGQDEILQGKTLMFCEYKNNVLSKSTHEHCIFCWHKFMEKCDSEEDCSNKGYCTKDMKYWICEKCFSDFAERFEWKLEEK